MQCPLIVCAALLAAPSALLAQRYNFKLYGEEEGLQNQVVQVLLQDRAGFLWAGTQNGLFRYDGGRFIAFGKADGLPAARIESLHETVDGTLWAGTGLGLARRAAGRFEPVALGVARGVAGRQGIASDAHGHLYVATERGLAVGGPEKAPPGWQFHLVPAPPSHSAGEAAASVYVDSHGAVWYGCGPAALCTVAQASACEAQASACQAQPVAEAEGLPPERWSAILEDLHGNLWVRGEHLLAVRPAGSRRFQLRAGLPPATNTFPALALDPDGRLLANTNRGLARETPRGWEVVGADQGLATNDVSAVMQDREGSIWLGFLGSGLARWLGYGEWQSWSQHDGLSRESVWAVARDAGGRLWVGTQFGLDYAEEHGGALLWRHQPMPGLQMIRALAGAPDGTLWAGGDRGGVRRLDPRTGVVRAFPGSEGLARDGLAREGLGNASILHLAIDAQGAVWAATRRGLYRGTGARFEQLMPPGTQPEEGFHMVLPDRQGRIWAAGDLGLARLENGRWTRFTTRDGLQDDRIAQVAETPDGALWIGYRDAYGLTRMTFAAGRPRMDHFGSSSGTSLRSGKTLFLGLDSKGRLWAGTDRGVDLYDGARWRHLARSDGLIWDDCNTNAFFPDSGGSVWIGTSRGLSRFEPRSTATPAVPPPVVFTSVKLGGKEVDAGAPLEVAYRQDALQVRFAALTFVQEPDVLFRYRLDNGSWLETPQRELNYPALLPGLYTLQVMARSAEGVWSAEPAQISVRVLPPWFLTPWFRLSGGLAALFLGWLLWRGRTRRLEAERNWLEGAVAVRTRELHLEKQRVVEEKARAEQENVVVQQQKQEIERLLEETRQASRFKSEFLANMSHEIRTPMNAILGMTDLVLVTSLTAEQRDYLETARASADSLLSVLNDVLDFSKIEAGKLDLNPTPFSLRQCVRETARIFSGEAARKRLELRAAVDAEVPDRLVGDPDRLRQVLLNLVGNAIKFTERGSVHLSVSRTGAGRGGLDLRFSVRDTGIGIPAEKQQLIFEAFRQADGSTTRRFGGTGLGLAICSRLVQLMGGRIWVESAGGSGSTFHFTARFAEASGVEAPSPSTADSLTNLLNATRGEALVRSLRVLLAEDNPINQRLATRLLERRGHRVALAESGRQALDRLASARRDQQDFDVVLMDVQMPDMDGLEATRAIRAGERDTGRHIPIIALTAYSMTGDRDRCLAAGMDAYVTKPIDAAEFLKVVEAVAALRESGPPPDGCGAANPGRSRLSAGSLAQPNTSPNL